jgi:P27 family predicted phage terminase small subunit
MTKHDIPHTLRREARDLIATVEQEYVLDPHERALLYQAGIALDLSLQAAEIVAAEGLTVKAANGGCKTHPAVAVQRNASATFATLLRALGLTADGRRTVPIPGSRDRLGGRVQSIDVGRATTSSTTWRKWG